LPVLEATKVEDPVLSRRWYPEEHHAGNDDFSSREELEGYSSRLMAELIGPFLSRGLRRTVEDDDTNNNNNDDNDDDDDESGEEKEEEYVIDTELLETANQMAYESARGRFVDFCGEKEGEKRLESFFLKAADTNVGKELLRRSSSNGNNNDASASASDDLVRFRKAVEGAVVTIQSLLVYAMTYGLTLNPTGVHRAVAHMKQDAEAVETTWTMDMEWTPAHSLRLKYLSFSDHDAEEKVPGLHLLSVLKWKRTPLRAYELLVQLGVWTKHENLTLLRSGIPLRFTEREEEIASRVARESERERKSESKSEKGDEHEHENDDDDDDDDTVDDPDTLLGIRRDLRSQKIYTIDSASTKEIDDGLGVEILEGDDGNGNGEKRYRYWIHIADADRWAKRDSELFQIARRRATSIYLPGKSIPMMPSSVSQQILSLRAQKDVCALSLGVELNDDGSIIEDSIVVTPSTVRVTYRLTYDDADEMLEDGIGYNEEWELGQLYTAAQRRRQFRIDNGSAEDFVPNQIPQYTISTFPDRDAHDEIGIKVDVQVSHNGGKNQSSAVGDNKGSAAALADELPVSSSFLLVTEMMILSGEAIGKWAVRETQASGKSTGNDDGDDGDDDDDGNEKAKNSLELPFRSQEAPDYRSRARERNIMTDLLECNIGGGYCHAWYSRRFFSPAKISPDALPHSGLGLGCYVQWTSPIRRFQDLQVHAAVKRFVRRQRVMELIENGSGEDLPSRLSPSDLGCDLPSRNADGKLELLLETVDEDIDYGDKTNLLKPAQFVMRNSNKFWMLEYIRRLREDDPQRTAEVLVLGCVNPSKKQYAVYLYEFGLEWRYNSPVGIQAGDRFVVRFGTVLPQNGQMTLIRVAASGSASGSGKSKNSGRGSKQ